jgi:hypothetical protein
MFDSKFASMLIAAAFACTAAVAADNAMRPSTPVARMPAPANVVTFFMAGAMFKFPLPADFCLPEGRYAARAQQTANGDAANVTSLSFDDCASMRRDGDLLRWGMIKTPRSLLNTDVGAREAVIAELKSQFASGQFERDMNQGMANAAGGSTSTTVRPLGTDPYGAYVGGTLTMNGRTFAAAWSMTSVKRRFLAVYMYGPYSGQRDVDDIVNRVRTATRNLVLTNGN